METTSSDQQLREEFSKTLRTVPDFPEKGINFKDITPLFMNPSLCHRLTDHLSTMISDIKPDVIAGIETRGYLFGFSLAQKLGVPFLIIRKAGKLPGEVVRRDYGLEYGKSAIEVQKGLVSKGSRVLIHDDLLATGGTAVAAAELIKEVGGEVAGFLFLIRLEGLKVDGREKLLKFSGNVRSFADL